MHIYLTLYIIVLKISHYYLYLLSWTNFLKLSNFIYNCSQNISLLYVLLSWTNFLKLSNFIDNFSQNISILSVFIGLEKFSQII